MKNYVVYMATNKINGKCYIGYTNDIEGRIKEHKSRMKSKNNIKFYNALRKYGFDYFCWEILAETSNIKYAKHLESKYIYMYDSMNIGYNSTPGGESSPMHNPEIAKKQGLKMLGKNNPMYGKHNSGSFKKGLIPWNKGKKGCQIAWNKGITGKDSHMSEVWKNRKYNNI